MCRGRQCAQHLGWLLWSEGFDRRHNHVKPRLELSEGLGTNALRCCVHRLCRLLMIAIVTVKIHLGITHVGTPSESLACMFNQAPPDLSLHGLSVYHLLTTIIDGLAETLQKLSVLLLMLLLLLLAPCVQLVRNLRSELGDAGVRDSQSISNLARVEVQDCGHAFYFPESFFKCSHRLLYRLQGETADGMRSAHRCRRGVENDASFLA
mmetsp:Transcript_146559/g.365468  ORF Transcript_146559/g.365468 Transcript_146559/m.365468 type:complete len:208 (+) Transcript_146559:1303-1926(+)